MFVNTFHKNYIKKLIAITLLINYASSIVKFLVWHLEVTHPKKSKTNLIEIIVLIIALKRPEFSKFVLLLALFC